jgi:hypothetical protein
MKIAKLAACAEKDQAVERLKDEEQFCPEQLGLQMRLNYLKDGIKNRRITTIVDGEDMTHWGWTTIEEMNKRLAKQAAKLKDQ